MIQNNYYIVQTWILTWWKINYHTNVISIGVPFWNAYLYNYAVCLQISMFAIHTKTAGSILVRMYWLTPLHALRINASHAPCVCSQLVTNWWPLVSGWCLPFYFPSNIHKETQSLKKISKWHTFCKKRVRRKG